MKPFDNRRMKPAQFVKLLRLSVDTRVALRERAWAKSELATATADMTRAQVVRAIEREALKNAKLKAALVNHLQEFFSS
jgi:hypothetical protein